MMFEGILLKPSMVIPGAEHKEKASPETIAKYTLTMLKRRVPPVVPGIMFLSGGQSEMEASLNLNAMNQTPNPWHVFFSYARVLLNTVLKTWQGLPEYVDAANSLFWCVQRLIPRHNLTSTLLMVKAMMLRKGCVLRAIHIESKFRGHLVGVNDRRERETTIFIPFVVCFIKTIISFGPFYRVLYATKKEELIFFLFLLPSLAYV